MCLSGRPNNIAHIYVRLTGFISAAHNMAGVTGVDEKHNTVEWRRACSARPPLSRERCEAKEASAPVFPASCAGVSSSHKGFLNFEK